MLCSNVSFGILFLLCIHGILLSIYITSTSTVYTIHRWEHFIQRCVCVFTLPTKAFSFWVRTLGPLCFCFCFASSVRSSQPRQLSPHAVVLFETVRSNRWHFRGRDRDRRKARIPGGSARGTSRNAFFHQVRGREDIFLSRVVEGVKYCLGQGGGGICARALAGPSEEDSPSTERGRFLFLFLFLFSTLRGKLLTHLTGVG